jgi:hypothetical protein
VIGTGYKNGRGVGHVLTFELSRPARRSYLPNRPEEGKVGFGRNRNFLFLGYDIVMQVVEGYKLVKLFASALKKERWQVVETKKFCF